MTNSQLAHRRPNGTTWALLILLGALWGGSFFFARVAVQEIAPLWLVFFRIFLAAIALHLFLFSTGQWSNFSAAPFLPFFGLGLLNNAIPFSLLFIGQTELGAGLASILNATTPFLTVIAAQLLTQDEKISVRKVAGTLLGIAGAVIVVGPAAFRGLGAPLWAQLCVIGATTSYAFASIYSKRFKDVPPLVTATGQLTASTLIMLPVALFIHGAPKVGVWSSNAWLAVLALALASTAFAYTLFFRIVAATSATFVSLVTLIVPISAILLGIAFLGESVSVNQFTGMVVIASGLMIMNSGFRR